VAAFLAANGHAALRVQATVPVFEDGPSLRIVDFLRQPVAD
jgi:hypothetical protein